MNTQRLQPTKIFGVRQMLVCAFRSSASNGLFRNIPVQLLWWRIRMGRIRSLGLRRRRGKKKCLVKNAAGHQVFRFTKTGWSLVGPSPGPVEYGCPKSEIITTLMQEQAWTTKPYL